MSMQYWPRQLAQLLGERLGIRHELQSMSDREIEPYLESRLASIPIEDFLIGVSIKDLDQTISEQESSNLIDDDV